jgi:hypothetical protein
MKEEEEMVESTGKEEEMPGAARKEEEIPGRRRPRGRRRKRTQRPGLPLLADLICYVSPLFSELGCLNIGRIDSHGSHDAHLYPVSIWRQIEQLAS